MSNFKDIRIQENTYNKLIEESQKTGKTFDKVIDDLFDEREERRKLIEMYYGNKK